MNTTRTIIYSISLNIGDRVGAYLGIPGFSYVINQECVQETIVETIVTRNYDDDDNDSVLLSDIDMDDDEVSDDDTVEYDNCEECKFRKKDEEGLVWNNMTLCEPCYAQYDAERLGLNDEDEDEDVDEEIQPHCYICYNMNMNLNVTCFNCDELYCKTHSYCILGDDDMPFCSKKCFYNC